ncbi:WD40/YVTN/BNR-like repeat-containing protein [Falsiroseomonas oryzae]|uniref:WD40/YVTN/BNR-like repeat-containing protein n=1 Tax=Falsiroseomonas oryzae TaxID=2766473 RepID=UPI0022EB0748|nr:sialidase family protein [Roseomonas sp. MO-31]
MSDRLLVATRKGLFIARPEGGDWRLGRPAFLGEPVSAVLHDPRDGALYAALRLGHFGTKLHRSDDGGASWNEVGVPALPAEGENPKALDMIWTLAAGGAEEPGVLWAGTLPAALFRSADRGESWQLVRGLWDVPERARWMGGGYDDPGLHSVLVDPRDARRLTVAISTGGVWRSADGGETWRLAGQGLRNEYMPPGQEFDRVVQDVHLLSCCAAAPDAVWAQHHNGIFRSTDGGESFEEVTAAAPSRFGFAVAAHPTEPGTAWFAPAVKDECRIPVEGRMVVTRTRDGGRSLEALSEGLPQADCYDLVYRHALVVDGTGTRLAMGSTTGNLWVSGDRGESWRRLAGHLPPIAALAFAAG